MSIYNKIIDWILPKQIEVVWPMTINYENCKPYRIELTYSDGSKGVKFAMNKQNGQSIYKKYCTIQKHRQAIRAILMRPENQRKNA